MMEDIDFELEDLQNATLNSAPNRTLEDLLQDLISDDVRTRARAAYDLRKHKSQLVKDSLLTALKDKEYGVRQQAIRSLWDSSGTENVGIFLTLLQSGASYPADIRARVADNLGHSGSSLVVAPLLEVLNSDNDADVREHAARALQNCSGLDNVEAFSSFLRSDTSHDSFVRNLVVYKLAEAGSPLAIAPLVELVNNDARNFSAAEALWKCTGPEQTEIFVRMLKNGDTFSQLIAVTWLSTFASSPGVDALLDALKQKRRRIRWAALNCLARIGRRTAIEDANEYERNLAERRIERFINLKGLSALEKFEAEGALERLKTKNELERNSGLEARIRSDRQAALERMEAESFIEQIIMALSDEFPMIRIGAITVLRSIASPLSLEPLLTASRDEDKQVRISAIEALVVHWNICESTKETVLNRFLEAIDDFEPSVRAAARRSLQWIRPAEDSDDLQSDLRDIESQHDKSVSCSETEPAEVHAAVPHKVDNSKRIEQLEDLGASTDDQSVYLLIEALKDSDSDVRSAAARTLECIRNVISFEALVSSIHDTDSHVSNCAVQALGALDDSRAIEVFLDILKNPESSHLWQSVAFELRSKPDPRAVEPLINALTNCNDEWVKAAAASALAANPDLRAEASLILAYCHEESWVHNAALEALCQLDLLD